MFSVIFTILKCNLSSIRLVDKVSVAGDAQNSQRCLKDVSKNRIFKQNFYEYMRELKITILKNFVFLLEIF
jgi:hypothetical protein